MVGNFSRVAQRRLPRGDDDRSIPAAIDGTTCRNTGGQYAATQHVAQSAIRARALHSDCAFPNQQPTRRTSARADAAGAVTQAAYKLTHTHTHTHTHLHTLTHTHTHQLTPRHARTHADTRKENVSASACVRGRGGGTVRRSQARPCPCRRGCGAVATAWAGSSTALLPPTPSYPPSTCTFHTNAVPPLPPWPGGPVPYHPRLAADVQERTIVQAYMRWPLEAQRVTADELSLACAVFCLRCMHACVRACIRLC